MQIRVGFFCNNISYSLLIGYIYTLEAARPDEINPTYKMSNILEVKKVVKKYGDYTALNEVSITVPNGRI